MKTQKPSSPAASSLEVLIDQIFARCEALGWTQTKLSLKAGVARESISRLRHRTDVDFSLLAKLCHATGLSIHATEANPLKLSFPYNWSNSSMNPSTLTCAVLERGIFIDILEVSRYFGLEFVRTELNAVVPSSVLWVQQAQRMLRNIERGFKLAQRRTPPNRQ
jgi:transcriptional regulator with XRE-family HTH domain